MVAVLLRIAAVNSASITIPTATASVYVLASSFSDCYCSSHKSSSMSSSSSLENVRVLETRFSGVFNMNCPAMSIV